MVSRVHECLARDVSNMNISPKISHGVLECDIVVTKLHGYDFVIKDFVIKQGGVICAGPYRIINEDFGSFNFKGGL